jgi:hypothetical protein
VIVAASGVIAEPGGGIRWHSRTGGTSTVRGITAERVKVTCEKQSGGEASHHRAYATVYITLICYNENASQNVQQLPLSYSDFSLDKVFAYASISKSELPDSGLTHGSTSQ